jgi:hypothetical protein
VDVGEEFSIKAPDVEQTVAQESEVAIGTDTFSDLESGDS